jgi:hypothetical protein
MLIFCHPKLCLICTVSYVLLGLHLGCALLDKPDIGKEVSHCFGALVFDRMSFSRVYMGRVVSSLISKNGAPAPQFGSLSHRKS